MRKIPTKKCWRVYNRKTKKVFARCTSLEKAQKQLSLLRGIQNNKSFAKKIRSSRRSPIQS